MAIHLCHDGGDGTTPADGHAQVVNRAGIRGFPNTPKLLEYAAHPRPEPEARLASRAERGASGHQEPAVTSVDAMPRMNSMQEMFIPVVDVTTRSTGSERRPSPHSNRSHARGRLIAPGWIRPPVLRSPNSRYALPDSRKARRKYHTSHDVRASSYPELRGRLVENAQKWRSTRGTPVAGSSVRRSRKTSMSDSIEARVEALEQTVRRLRDVVERYFPQLVVHELRDKLHSTVARGTPGSDTAHELVPISLDDQIREVESTLIGWAMKVSHGNKSRAADLLKVKRSTLGDRINRCGIRQVERAASAPLTAAAEAAGTDTVPLLVDWLGGSSLPHETE
jgi:hypothetical protein